MLKIKDNVDLDELKKFGFKWYGCKEFKCLSFYVKGYIQGYDNGSALAIDIYPTDRILHFYDTRFANVLFDLIQANLVEKVEE